MKILETDRTILREINESDAEFILDLLNQPSFIKYIGDRNVRDLEQSRDFIENRFRASYKNFGYGLWAVELKENNTPIGICGFVKRDFLPEADIGFAFLARFERQGFGFEAAKATLEYGRERLNLGRVLAVTSENNEASRKLLEKLNFKFERLIEPPNGDEKLKLFSSDAPPKI